MLVPVSFAACDVSILTVVNIRVRTTDRRKTSHLTIDDHDDHTAGASPSPGSIDAKSKRTTPRIPTWSPTVVLTRPDHA